MKTRLLVSLTACLLIGAPCAAQTKTADLPPALQRKLKQPQDPAPLGGDASKYVTVEPLRLDYGDVNRGDKQTMSITITNISADPVKIARAFTTCGCTVPNPPKEAIAPGESIQIPVEFTGKAPGPAGSTVRFFFDENKGEVPVSVTAYVRFPIVSEPAIYPSDLTEDLEITLTSTDGTPFQIMAVDPPVLDGVTEDRKEVHTVILNAKKLEKAGPRRFRIRIYTDHNRIDSILLRSDRIQATNETASLLAWARGTGEVVELARFVERGIDVDDADPQGRTSLMFAALNGKIDRVRALLDFGADITARTNDQRTALMHAAQTPNGNVETVQLLIDAGADPNARDRFGRTSLFWAARGADAKRIKLLISYGADVNLRGPSGETPLVAAVKSQKIENVSTLLEAGANPLTADSKGRRPMDHAKVFLARSRNQDLRAKATAIIDLLQKTEE